MCVPAFTKAANHSRAGPAAAAAAAYPAAAEASGAAATSAAVPAATSTAASVTQPIGCGYASNVSAKIYCYIEQDATVVAAVDFWVKDSMTILNVYSLVTY